MKVQEPITSQPDSNTEPDYLIRIRERQATLKARCSEIFANNPEAVTLEFGCGHGHYLTAYAQAFPEEFCLGIDLVTKRIEKATAKAEKRHVQNALFLKAEAREFLYSLPDTVRLSKIFMLFPDPWPKKRHFKNRMVQNQFLSDLARISKPGARFHFRTDHPGYFDWAHEIIEGHPDWEISEEPWPFEERSFFQDMMDSWQSLIACRRG